MDLEKLISLRIQLTDIVDGIKKAQEEQIEPYKNKLEKLNELILSEMAKQGITSVNTKSGRAVQKVLTGYKVEDFEKVVAFAIQQQRFDLFKREVVKSVADEFPEIPGVVCNNRLSLSITRK